MRLLLLILLPLFSFAQVNIKTYGARESYADNSAYIQKAIDVCVRTGSNLIIPKGQWRIQKPLVVANYDSLNKQYQFAMIKILGESTPWDMGNRSVIIADFGDAPVLSMHLNKGSVVDGIVFRGKWKRPGSPFKVDFDDYRDSTTRDSRFSPYTAIAIDPFMYRVPDDGGYPTLTRWYRGKESRSGSTGVTVKNCVFNGFTVGAITSPNGWTQNAEFILFDNIQIVNCKAGFAGCQDQEKMNRITNIGAWGTTHTVFVFNKYGYGTPGMWIIDGVNIAGEVYQVIHRFSGGYYPVFISNLFAESIFQFGYWQTNVGDRLSNSVIDFCYPNQHNALPFAHFEGGGVTLSNVLARVYGTQYPIVFMGNKSWERGWWTLENVKITESFTDVNGNSVKPTIVEGFLYEPTKGIDLSKVREVEVKDGLVIGGVTGKVLFFMDYELRYRGIGLAENGNVKYKSVGLNDGHYKIVVK